MSRITTPLVALVLCITLCCLALPRARASAPGSPKKETKQGESCATCPSGKSGRKGEWVNKFATAGRRTQQMPFQPVQRSVFDGARINLVGTADGSLVFAVTDLKVVSGLTPLLFQRVYSSDRTEDRGLGAGWSFAYDDRIRMAGDGAVLSTGAGAEIAFSREGEGGRFVLNTPEPGLHQSFEEAADGTLVESAAGMTRTYKRVGGEYRLARVSDPNGNAIAMSFDRRGNISRIEGVGGQSLTLSWSAGKSSGKRPQLLSVTDNAGRHVSFVVRGGRLAAVVDQAGSRWAYEYAGGRLAGATDPLGRVVLRARYDSEGRAVESGDAVGSHLFEYEGGGRTVITDPMGAKTSITHTALGAVSSATDAEGLTTTVEYDESNRAKRAADSSGNEQTFAREAGNVGGAAAQAAGGVAYTYDARGNVLEAQSGDPATSYRAVRNGRGQPVSLRAESGREMTFEYGAAGNETAFTYSDLGRFEKSYDVTGRVISRRLPSGQTFAYAYDAGGEVARVGDSAGRALAIDRDAGGMIAGVTAEGGRRVRVTRDEAGRVTRMEASDGKMRQFAYDARGALTYYRDAQGRQYGMTYDRAGRLRKVDKSDGVTLNYRYGRDGRVASVSREERGTAGFVKAGFSALPRLAARDYEDDPMGCMLLDDGFGWYYDPCDPAASYGDPDAVLTAWEYTRTGGLVPLPNPTNPATECVFRGLAACEAERTACLFNARLLTAVELGPCTILTGISCVLIFGRKYLNTAGQCDTQAEACRLRVMDECLS